MLLWGVKACWIKSVLCLEFVWGFFLPFFFLFLFVFVGNYILLVSHIIRDSGDIIDNYSALSMKRMHPRASSRYLFSLCFSNTWHFFFPFCVGVLFFFFPLTNRSIPSILPVSSRYHRQSFKLCLWYLATNLLACCWFILHIAITDFMYQSFS